MEIVKDLCERLHELRLRYQIVFREADEATLHANPPYIPMAEQIVAGLRAETRAAVTITQTLVGPDGLADTAFWTTSLGRRLFAAGGYVPGEWIGQAFAASVLGCSRQWISQLLAQGRLTSGSSRMVNSDEVRALLKTRIDELDK